MKQLFLSRSFHVAIAAVIIGFIVFMVVSVRSDNNVELITAVVERGVVEQLVSVSGVIEAEQSADLAFPTTGIVASVPVAVGDEVAAGDVLITLETQALQADRADAVATLNRAIANRDELLAGPAAESRNATAQTVSFKTTTLETIKATQAELVANAYRTLLSSGLTATTDDPREEAVPPQISGTYTCDTPGTYIMTMYSSGANSGYSFRLGGIESGNYPASTEQPASFGTCGLSAIFDSDSRYNNAVWTIEIPNRQSPTYTTNRNAYSLAQTQASSAIAVAQQDLALAQANANNTNAPARSEAIARANADIASANARIARIDAQIADRTLRAPFAGLVIELDVLPGETVTASPVVTVLAASDFELTARIPEIDIGQLQTGQMVKVVFDARADQELTGTVNFISPQATEIDGVAYYEAIISLDNTPSWIRGGLNADLDIVTTAALDTLRLPVRFITDSPTGPQVTQKQGDLLATTTINVVFTGNDGYAAITGLNENDVVVLP